MKATGIVRRVDDLGRIVLPKELRRTFGISDGDPLEIYTDGNMILLKKYDLGADIKGAIHQLREGVEVLYNADNRGDILTKIAELEKAVGTNI